MSTHHAIREWLRNRVILAAALVLWTGCATPQTGSDETHFLCSADADCKPFGDDRICEIRRCVQAPAGYPTSADGSPVLDLPPSADVGPAADCTRVLPDDAASFETSARRLPPSTVIQQGGPVLSPNGDAIFYAAATELIGTSEIIRGHMVRWVHDSLTWHGESPGGLVLPEAVSCDGFTVMGWQDNRGMENYPVPQSAVRWSAASGYETLPLDRFPREMALHGDALYGFQDGTPTVAMEWRDGAEPRILFQIPDNGAGDAWGRGGNTFVFRVDAGPFVKVGDDEAAALTLTVPDGCEVSGTLTSVSADGRAVVGSARCGLAQRDFVWTADEGAILVPENSRVKNVVPGGVAAGTQWHVGNAGDYTFRDFVWDPRHGLRYLEDVLADHGVEVPPSVVIKSVSDVSDDARVFTGTCLDERDPGRENIFRAVLPAGTFKRP